MLFCCLVAKLCLTLFNPMDWGMPDFPVLCHLLEFAQILIHWVGDGIQLSHSLLPLLLLPSFFPSTGSFPKCWLHIRLPKYWNFSFSFSISPFNGHSGLIPFRIDWFHFFAVQGALKHLLQHHNSKASIFWHSAFPGGSDGRESACNAGDPGLIPVSGRSPGEGNGSPVLYSCLENSIDRGAWWATVQGAAKS